MTTQLRLAVIRDFRAEGWPSMDLCADELLAHLPAAAPAIKPTDIDPPFRRRFQKVPILGRRGAAFNADRLYNRHIYLPGVVRRRAGDFDFFHIADHSYAHLALSLPPGRVGVYCHDLDAFRSILTPELDRRPWWFRKLARRTFAGLCRAAVVFHNSRQVGLQLAATGCFPSERLVHVPLGVAAEFIPTTTTPVDLPIPIPAQYVLHIGNHIPRKRIDVLLDVFAVVKARVPGVRLIQVGPPWSRPFADQIARLGIGDAITQLRGFSREQLAELYRRAAVVIVPSDAEGFGLPVIEALACGAAVVASDLPVLREVGGDCVIYRPVAAIGDWADAVVEVLQHPPSPSAREDRVRFAAQYSWPQHARTIGEEYLRLANR